MLKVIASKNLLKLTQRTVFNQKVNSTLKLQQTELENVKVNEVRIDVPRGHVAGKWYESSDKRPIVMIHGWQDNAGSFDRLIPLLPKHMSYLSIDLPGHGHSSRLPNGMCYTIINCLHVINLIRRHYNWNKISICSHSFGNMCSIPFAALYPDRCDLLISLDGTSMPSLESVEQKVISIRKLRDDFLTLDSMSDNGDEASSYSYEILAHNWAKSIIMTREQVEPLMKRGVIQSKSDLNKYFMSNDVRLKNMEFGPASISNDIRLELVKHITAPHLLIKTKTLKKDLFDEKSVEMFVNILTKSNSKFEYHDIPALQYCHLSQPEIVSGHISNFINKFRPSN